MSRRSGNLTSVIILLVFSSVAQSSTVEFPGLTWDAYPGYEGHLGVSSTSLSLSFSDNTVAISYVNLIADASCSIKPDGNVTNSCGIHVHEGKSCDAAGGHFYNTTSNGNQTIDPWLKAYYVPGSSCLSVNMGLTASLSAGRTLVIHDRSGARIACQVIPEPVPTIFQFQKPEFGPFPGYTGPWEVKADSLSMVWKSKPYYSSVTIAYSGLLADPDCTTVDTQVKNSCGIQIYEGFSCSAAGDHYYNDTLSVDPWLVAYYEIGSNVLEVEYGEDFASSRGRTLVVHNRTGGPIACMELRDQIAFLEYGPIAGVVPRYPGYNGTANVSAGAIYAQFEDGTGTTIEYFNMAADPSCTEADVNTPNSCGLHIHEGYDCAAAGGHYYDPTLAVDPWLVAYYTPGSGKLQVEHGFDYEETIGRSLVVHDRSGQRIACIPIGIAIVPDLEPSSQKKILPKAITGGLMGAAIIAIIGFCYCYNKDDSIEGDGFSKLDSMEAKGYGSAND